MMMIPTARARLIRATVLSGLCIALCPSSQAAVAGRFLFVAGDVRIADHQGKERAATKGGDVSEGETVVTAAASSAQLKMIDDGIIALRPDTHLAIDTYAMQGKQDDKSQVGLSLLKGGLRAITGLIGKVHKENVKLRTPNATIGIRGTDHETVVIPPPPPGMAAIDPPGTYDRVNVGATSLTTQAGTAVIAVNQVGFAASPNQLPVLLPALPAFFQAAPAPQARQEPKPAAAQTKEAAASTSASSTSGTTTASTSDSTSSSSPTSTTSAPSTVSLAGSADTGIQSGALLPGVTPLPPVNLTATDSSGTTVNLAQPVTAPISAPVSLIRGVGIADGWENVFNPTVFNGTLTLNLDGQYHGSLDGGLQPAAGVIDNSAGLLEFKGQASGYTPMGGAMAMPASSPTSLSTIRIGTALNRDVGSVNIGGVTASWGRWEGGAIDIFSGDGATKLGTLDNTNRSVHWFALSPMDSASFAMPLTGTANYTVAGNTLPTDFAGNTGTLNGVSLYADFANAKVNAALAVNFNQSGNTSSWNMTATNIPIVGSDFKSNTEMNGTNGISHTVNCSCGSQAIGYISGHFFNKAQGVGISYGMAASNIAAMPGSFTPTNPASMVTGTVVMQRQ